MVQIDVLKQQPTADSNGCDQVLFNKNLLQTSQANNMDKVNNSSQQSTSIDLALVAKARASLRQLNESEAGAKFDKSHYEELMNDKSPESCWRYIVHCDKDVKQTIELMKEVLIWRKENDIAQLKDSNLVKDLWLFAPIGFTGTTKEGQDVLYIVGKHYRKPDTILKETIRKFILNMIFGWDKKHQHDLSKYTVVFDVSDTGISNIDLDFTSWLVSIRDYVPQRIEHIYIIGIPFVVRPLIKLIISWLSEKFRRITHCGTFDELVRANIDDESLPVEVGGLNSTYRLAPIDSIWASESPIFGEKNMQEAMDKCVCFHLSEEQRQKICQMQMDYEKNLSK